MCPLGPLMQADTGFIQVNGATERAGQAVSCDGNVMRCQNVIHLRMDDVLYADDTSIDWRHLLLLFHPLASDSNHPNMFGFIFLFCFVCFFFISNLQQVGQIRGKTHFVSEQN